MLDFLFYLMGAGVGESKRKKEKRERGQNISA